MRRLHWQFYFAILATMGLFIVASIVLWHATSSSRDDRIAIETAAKLAEQLLPPPSASPAQNQKIISAVSAHLGTGIALFDEHGAILARAGHLPNLDAAAISKGRGWSLTTGGPVWIIPLDDGRRLVFQPAHHLRPHGPQLLGLSVAAVIAFALGAYPIARRLTKRVVELKSGVEQFGQGDVSARVPVRGNDEVAALARSFNAAAERIATLMQSQKMLLANCSHELRTPLARIRLAIERLSNVDDASVREEVDRNVAELDTLIEELLLASRLDTAAPLLRTEDVDLLALAAEEAAHYDTEADGEVVNLRGDSALLRRLIRNLLDNAQRHARGASRVHVAKQSATHALLVVEDRGPGIDPADRADLFTPFHTARSGANAARGYGLGLSIVRQIARAHGGDVEYSAMAEGGSRFSVRLPIGSRVN
jgi:signal transduction histidine kinase